MDTKNRVVMAPMTRARNADRIPNQHTAVYYAQRAGAGLIVTEGTAISSTSMGFLHIPGLYTPEQVKGWQLVTKAVHLQNARIYTQLWHVGRVSHTSIQPDGQAPQGVSDKTAANSFAWGYDASGNEAIVPCSQPRAMTTSEVREVIILAGGMTTEKAEKLIARKVIDLAAFGEAFIANPDLVDRLQHNWPLAPAERAYHYGGGLKGYTDYKGYIQ